MGGVSGRKEREEGRKRQNGSHPNHPKPVELRAPSSELLLLPTWWCSAFPIFHRILVLVVKKKSLKLIIQLVVLFGFLYCAFPYFEEE